MKADCHNHSIFSPDGAQTIEQAAERAAELGFGYIAFTEHMDLGFPNESRPADELIFDYKIDKRYFEAINAARVRLGNKIHICGGVEVGFTPKDVNEICEKLAEYPFEYIINSVHICHGLDCYWKSYWEGYDRKRAYGEYLRCVRDSLDAPYRYDAVGHLGYIGRPSPFEKKTLLYEDFPALIDDILKTIISKDKILEANSSTGKCAPEGTVSLPDMSIFERYYELGGRKVNFGSDSHRTEKTGYNYERVAENLRRIGFTHWTVKINGKEIKEAID